MSTSLKRYATWLILVEYEGMKYCKNGPKIIQKKESYLQMCWLLLLLAYFPSNYKTPLY
jgi:hypothetical protein